MKILVTGSSGLIGRAFAADARANGHESVPLLRRPAEEPHLLWDPSAGRLDRSALEGFDAVVHLAGKSIADGRWTEARKREIRDSRVRGTALLAEALAVLSRPPRVFLCASAVGYYGDRGEETLTEASAIGTGFLSEVCRDWEAAAAPARAKGVRTVHARFGVVLSPAGGALAKMLLPFRLGLGGAVGTGRQWMPWVALSDAVGALRFALETPALEGPVNVVAPGAATNGDFTRALGRALGRPTVLPMPAFAARLLLGEMADALLLASQKVRPDRLSAAGYRFRAPDLDAALAALRA